MLAVSHAKDHLRGLIVDAWDEYTRPSLQRVVCASMRFLILYLEKATLSELCDLIDMFEDELKVPVWLASKEGKHD